MRHRSRWAVAVAVVGCAAVVAACAPRQPWRSELASVNAAGTSGGDGDSVLPAFSPGGTEIGFLSRASDLGPNDTNGLDDLYVRDLTADRTTLVSVNAAGTDSGNGAVYLDHWDLSPDGTEVVFATEANDLVPIGVDRGGFSDVYLRDLDTGTTTLISVNAAGTGNGNGPSTAPQFSPDGTQVVFVSRASDLGPTDTNGADDVYLRDLTTGVTTLVAPNAAGDDSVAVYGTTEPRFSPDGTRIAFSSSGSDLGPPVNGAAGISNVYVRDLAAATTTLVSATPAGTGADGSSFTPDFSPDGTKVVFWTGASDLGPTDTNRLPDVYVGDLAAGTTVLVSTNAAGTDAGNASSLDQFASFSPDSASVVFESMASDLVPVDTNTCRSGPFPEADPCSDVFVRDLAAGRTTLVSANATGTDSGNARSGDATFSPDGARVVFESAASDLGPTDTNGATDIFVRDLAAATTTLVSANAAGTDSGNGESREPVFSPDGTMIAYSSDANDLGPPDAGSRDVYVARVRGADLSVTVDASPEPVARGHVLTYDLAVANAGPDRADDAAVALLLPEGTTFRTVTTSRGRCDRPSGDRPRAVVACRLGDLASGDDAHITVTATVTARPGATLTALAVATSPTIDPDGDDNAATVDSTVAPHRPR